MKDNMNVFDFELAGEDMTQISSLERNDRLYSFRR